MNVGVFGLGIIGAAWADNLVADGHTVRGWNRTTRSQPYYTPDARAAASASDLLILVVADPAAVSQVLDLIGPALRPGQIVVQSSTIDAASSRAFAARVEAAGAAFLEAPFTGSKPAAAARKTVFYTGGDPAVLERARPVLAPLSRAILHIGPVGSASEVKLALNINIALVAEALCESLAFARAGGISADTFFQALRLNAAWSGLTELKEPKLKEGDYAPQFSVKHMAKDLRLARASAPAQALPQMDGLLALYAEGLNRGWAEDDFIGLERLLQPGRQPGGKPGA